MGYVLSVWGDGAIQDAIYDVIHSPTAKSYEKYIRDAVGSDHSLCTDLPYRLN